MKSSWPTGSVVDRIMFALAEVRPALRADGGDVDFLGVEGTVVRVHLRGACKGCPMASSTLAEFVAERVRLYVPEITDVRAE